MRKKSIRDIDVAGKRVLVRVDFNVPVDESTGRITDDSRIRAALPTIRYAMENGARVVLASHLGRPDGKIDEAYRMTGVAQRLSELLGRPVEAARDCVGPEAERMSLALEDGDVLMLENVRFHPGEEAGSPEFARDLARLADVFVNDAFGTAHRSHASIVGVAEHLPAVAGFLMEKELENLGGVLESPARPFAALLGGAKVSDKVGMLENIMGKVDYLLIGGGMAATFIRARGGDIGLSLVEEDRLETAARLMRLAAVHGVDLVLPADVLVAREIAPDAEAHTVVVGDIGPEHRIVDIGPRTIEAFGDRLGRSKTIFWNGPMGIYEIPGFSRGTEAMAGFLADSEAATIIGGGSTAEAVGSMGLVEKMTFVSTGGGASLRFLGGEVLPGVAALLDKE
jgi:phosphoglycerate kinase